MELRQLEYFIAVSDCRNFTRAAEKCYISQPAITMAINSLESELNLTLFTRTKRNVELTNEGKVFYNYVLNVLQELDYTRMEMDRLREKKNGLVKVAVSPLVCSQRFFPHWLAYNDSQERITVVYTECERERALRQLDEWKVDFAIITGEESKMPEKRILILHGNLQLVSRRPIISPDLEKLNASMLLVAQDGDEDILPEYVGSNRVMVQRLFLHDWGAIIREDVVALLPDWIYPGPDLYTTALEPPIEMSIAIVYKKNTPSLECLKFLNHLVIQSSNEMFQGSMS